MSQLGFLVPPQYTNVMERLFENCPQSKFKNVRQVVEEDLNAKLEDIYDSTFFC